MVVETGAPPGIASRGRAPEYNVIGRSVPRVDALEKVMGRATYAGDLSFSHMLHGKVLRSRHPHAKILHIDTSAAESLPGVKAVLTAKDIPGVNRYGLAIEDQEALASSKVRSCADAVALVAAETLEIAEEAVGLIRVEYEELPGVFSPLEALQPGAPKVHEPGNLLQHTRVRKGDVEAGFREADVMVENTYRTQAVDHAYLETESGVAAMDVNGFLTIWSSTQYPFRDRRQIAPVVGLDFNKVRVVNMVCGGGFGGKDDITVEIHLALLALKTQRPVRLVNSREESIRAHTKRHPMIIEYKSGARRDGRLTAIEVEVYGDTGAYASLGPYVVKKAGIHACGPYYIPNVKVNTYTVYTNNTVSGPMRGFGVVQAAVAHEAQMDLLAERLGISPLEIRLRNALDVGLTTATSQVLRHSVGIKATLHRIEEYMEANGLYWGARP